jgi:hypothetical protein
VSALGVARMGKLKSRALMACELLGTRLLRSYVGLAFFFFGEGLCPCETAEDLRVRRRMQFGTYEGEMK